MKFIIIINSISILISLAFIIVTKILIIITSKPDDILKVFLIYLPAE